MGALLNEDSASYEAAIDFTVHPLESDTPIAISDCESQFVCILIFTYYSGDSSTGVTFSRVLVKLSICSNAKNKTF